MRAKLSLAIASVLVSVLAATAPADAACKKFGFTVNDYGKEGPTNDAKNLLDKHIAEWAAQNGVTAYQTGKKNVSCELFLDVILFDEHTCTASASVCWGDGVKPNNKGAEQAGGAAAEQPKSSLSNGDMPPAPVSKAEALGIPPQQQTAAAPATLPHRRPRRRADGAGRADRRSGRDAGCNPAVQTPFPRPRRRAETPAATQRPLSRPAPCRLARAAAVQNITPPAAPPAPEKDRAAAAAAAASAAAAAERAADGRRDGSQRRQGSCRCRRCCQRREQGPRFGAAARPRFGRQAHPQRVIRPSSRSTDLQDARLQRRAFSFALGVNVEAQPVALVGEQHHAANGGEERAERRGTGDEEHDQHLILGSADRIGTGNDLAGHHAGQCRRGRSLPWR